MSASDYETKISASLLAAMRADASAQADVMVQFESPEQALERGCATAGAGASRGERTTCLVDSLQHFAEAAQEELKALLARAPAGSYASSSFFWINNSAAVKKASAALIEEIAQLAAVREVRAEQIFQLHGSAQADADAPTKKKPLGRMALGVVED
ncbi:hypothetical protein PybrP1_007825 [[Pythium] brassicae (nom. inval.)]|nr:hypothetical protein PybrP1_007825 [[Pythium] brassicae (nom. inval.)]